MKRRKIRMQRIWDVPKKYLQHLHPSLRIMVERNPRRWKIRRAEGQRIRNRLLYYRPQARVFPWFCDTCTLSSRFLSVIQDHSCPNKNLSRHVQDFNNEQRIALLGFRSKAKDALAVLERVVNPQAVDLGSVRFPKDEGGSSSVCVVPRLSELCLSVLSRPKSLHELPIHEQRKIQFCSEPSASHFHPSKHTGQLCTICRRLFPTFVAYEDHLVNELCKTDIAPDPVPIQMSDSGTIPLNYVYSPENRPIAKPRLMICSLCHDDRFSTSQQFHEHILECANKLALL
ncbi:unnamed protein product [Cylicocyclus nassatus]|uniref:Uncharacterized protein n=1 Tax=Cylicocyclus nassatus TaxID=53992 RepID=A0AA36MCR9_CYLNA|nr:unnamed protein product [Cylicocyclus nassatus]